MPATLSTIVAAVLCAAPATQTAPEAHHTRRAFVALDEGNRVVTHAPLPLEKLCATAIRGCTYNRQVWLPGWLTLRLARQGTTFRATVVGLADAPGKLGSGADDLPPALRTALEEGAQRRFAERPPEWLSQCVVDSLRGKSFAWTGDDTAECRVEHAALTQVDDAALGAQVGACLGPASRVRQLTASLSQVVHGDEVHVEGLTLAFDGPAEVTTEACVRQAFQLPPVRITDRPPFEALQVTLEVLAAARRLPPDVAKEPQRGGPRTPRTALDDEVDAAEACVRERPDDARCQLDLGKAMAKRATRDGMTSDRDRAAAAYHRFLELAPNHPLAPKVRNLLEAVGM